MDVPKEQINENTGLIWINTFSTNIPSMQKPGCWFLLAKCLKNTCGRVTFVSEDAGHRLSIVNLARDSIFHDRLV